MIKVIKDYSFKPMKVCKGRKYRIVPKLFRHKCFQNKSSLCNELFTEKNKIRFMTQIFRWFLKDPSGFKVNFFLKLYNYKSTEWIDQLLYILLCEGDIIYLSCRTYKAAFKNLLLKLDYKLIDYKKIKRRRYNLFFTFQFFNLNESTKNITLDIVSLKNENFNILITLNSFYFNDFEDILDNAFIHEHYEKRNLYKQSFDDRCDYEEYIDKIITPDMVEIPCQWWKDYVPAKKKVKKF